jgi:hypothetical protein
VLSCTRFALLAVALTGLATVARAELQRLEVLGVVPAREQAPKGISPRQAALRAGVADAVLQTALRLAVEAGGAPELEPLGQVLGEDPFAYAVRFRLLEDRGEHRRRFLKDPEVQWEYVVLIEVHLDLDRVRERLAETGLLGPVEPAGPVRAVRVAVEGLGSFQSYQAIRERLRREARSFGLLEFAPGRAVIELETDRSTQELLDRLLADLPEGLQIAPIEVDEKELRIRTLESPSKRKPRARFEGAELGAAAGAETGGRRRAPASSD